MACLHPAPHMQFMGSRKDDQSVVSQDASAIARWHDEGGASAPGGSNTGAGVSNPAGSLMTRPLADLKVDPPTDDDQRTLQCLGAAVIMRWGTLPTKIQREL